MLAAQQVIQQGNMLFSQLVRSFQQAYNQVWKNREATPDAVVAAMGTNALNVFTASAGLAGYLNSLGATPALPTTIVEINPATKAVWAFTPVLDGSGNPTGAATLS